MTTEPSDQTWADLYALQPAERVAQMIERCRAVAAMDDAARLNASSAMVRAEYALTDEHLHEFTTSRLRAWIAIDQADREAAVSLARAYDAVFQTMPGAVAMRRASVVQGVARSELTADELATLFELIPSIVQQVPRVRQDVLSTGRDNAAALAAKSKPWWRFW